MGRYILLLILVLFQTLAHANWLPHVTNFTVYNSDAGRQNWDIAQGDNGWLYIANNEGMLEYNGADWTTYKLDNKSVIRSVETSSNGVIYAGGLNEFGRFEPDENGRLTYNNLSEGLTSSTYLGEVWGIHSIKDNTYFRLRRQIIIYDGIDELTQVESDGMVMASCTMNQNLYFVTTKGLFVMGEKSAICISTSESLPFGQVSSMCSFDGDKLLIATSFNGIFIYDKGVVSKFTTAADDILMNHQLFSIVANQHSIACGTVQSGVIIMDLDGKSFEQIDINGGLGNNTILSLMYDRENNLWCGLDNGVDQVIINSPLRSFKDNTNYRFTGYCTLITEHNNRLYMGTNQGLVYSYGIGNHANLKLNIVEHSEGQIWNIQRIGDDILCSHTRGLFRVDESTNRPSLYPIFTDDGVWGVNEISNDKYLVGTYEGLQFMEYSDEDGYIVKPLMNYDRSARKIFVHKPSKSCFVVVEEGLEQLEFNSDYSISSSSLILSSNKYDIMPFEIDGELVIYTPSQIYTVDDDGTLSESNKYDNILDKGSSYSYIYIDDKKNIWYELDNVLLRRDYDNSTNSYKEDVAQLFENRNFFIEGFTQINPLDGRNYIINNIYGFSIIDSHWHNSYVHDPQPVVVGLYSQDSLLMSGAHGVKKRSIELPYCQNSLLFLLGSDNVNDGAIAYSFRLRGNDDTWSDWSRYGERNSASIFNRKEYTNLREGKYNFDLRTRGKSGVINESTLEIVITPPWQRSTIMYIIYILIAITLSLYLRRIISRYYEARRRLVEIKKEREMAKQKREFISKTIEQENSIIKLNNEKLESEVIAKSTELSNLLLNKLEKNDIIANIQSDLEKIRVEVVNGRNDSVIKRITSLRRRLDDKMIDNVDWGAFEENFNLINNNFVQKLVEQFSWLSINERKLCVYVKMGLQNKEIAPLLNLSVRGVEMLRYRIRKKMELDRNSSLYEFLQSI